MHRWKSSHIPGQYFDAETGQHYNYFRDYQPGSGRYSQSDPIGLNGDINTYGYALSNPIMRLDLNGLQAQPRPTPPQLPSPTPSERFPNLPPSNDPVFKPDRTPGTSGAASSAVRACVSNPLACVLVLCAFPSSTSACDTVERTPQCDDQDKPCPPCRFTDGTVVPVGTIGYRLDKVPPSRPHHPYLGDHYNLFRANQNPNNCQCFWQPIGASDAAGGLPPPIGSIPLRPFLN